MSNPYRARSRHSDSTATATHYHLAQPVAPSLSSFPFLQIPTHSPNHAGHYSSPSPAQYSYPAPAQFSPQSTNGYYSTSSPSHLVTPRSDNVHSRTSLASHPMQPTYSATVSTSERASKRHKAGTAPVQGAYVQVHRTSVPQGDKRYPSHTSHDSRNGRESSVSSGYSSPGYSQSHDPYAQQHFQPPSIPGVDPSAMHNTQFYGTSHYRNGSSEYEEEERLDHGPTELPPRTYSGKSKYDPPRKPGKIPGSAMDYVRLRIQSLAQSLTPLS